jgi:hypothetical protein
MMLNTTCISFMLYKAASISYLGKKSINIPFMPWTDQVYEGLTIGSPMNERRLAKTLG